MKRTKKKLTIGPNDAITSFGLETGVAGVGACLQGGRWKVCGGAGAGAGAGGRWWELFTLPHQFLVDSPGIQGIPKESREWTRNGQ